MKNYKVVETRSYLGQNTDWYEDTIVFEADSELECMAFIKQRVIAIANEYTTTYETLDVIIESLTRGARVVAKEFGFWAKLTIKRTK